MKYLTITLAVIAVLSLLSAVYADEFIQADSYEYRFIAEGSGNRAVLGNNIEITYFDCDEKGNPVSDKSEAAYILGLSDEYGKWTQLLLQMRAGDAVLIRTSAAEYLCLKLDKIQGAVQPEAYDIEGKSRIRTESGLQYIILSEGEGSKAAPGYTVTFHYTMYLEDMTLVTSSYAEDKPVTVKLGIEPVIIGWFEGLVKMREGDSVRLIIPPDLSYRDGHWPEGVPHGETLVFDIDVLRVR